MSDIHFFGEEHWGEFTPFEPKWPKGLLYDGQPVIQVRSEDLHFWRKIETLPNGDQRVLESKSPFPGATEIDLRPAFRVKD